MLSVEVTSVISGAVLVGYLMVWYKFTPRKLFEDHQKHNRASFQELGSKIYKMEDDTNDKLKKLEVDMAVMKAMVDAMGRVEKELRQLTLAIGELSTRVAVAENEIENGHNKPQKAHKHGLKA
jgi:hypothetical protein